MLHLLIIERGRCWRCWKEESFREKQNKSSEDESVRLRVENQNDFNRNKEIKKSNRNYQDVTSFKDDWEQARRTLDKEQQEWSATATKKTKKDHPE